MNTLTEYHIRIQNAKELSIEFEWLERVLNTRFRLFFGEETEFPCIEAVECPVPDASWTGEYGSFVLGNKLNPEERLVLLLALCPHIRPDILEPLFVPNSAYNRLFSAFGGYSSPHFPFIPTTETALWLLADKDLQKRFELQEILSSSHFLIRNRILRIEKVPGQIAETGGILTVSEEYIHKFSTGNLPSVGFSADFPAEITTTLMDREDIILNKSTWNSVQEILDWLEWKDSMMNLGGLKKRLRPGFRALFYGPPGTGKTLVATWLGKCTGKEVYRIDLSMIISKYIGETEKNLAKVFDKAQNKNWILFFDEADALFGKRTEVSSSNDRFANQEVSYLLQRVESYNGLVILASNFKNNIDEAFARRFDAMVHFPVPDIENRRRLWESSFSPDLGPDPGLDLDFLAEKHELSGGHIVNIIRYCTIQALKHGRKTISADLLRDGITKEYNKLGIFRNVDTNFTN